MAKKIFIIGYFGYKSGRLDGQTVKTRNIRDLIEKHADESYIVRYYDTEEFRSNKFSTFNILKGCIWCDETIIIPERNSLTYIFPIVYFLSRLFRFDIIHIAIGSKQADFFRNKKWFRKRYIRMGRGIKAFLTEVSSVGKDLQDEFGFRNTGISRNFRVHDFIPNINNCNDGLKIVFMSRVTPSKGTAMIFRIGEFLEGQYPGGDVSIDIYGPVTDEEESFFENIEARRFVEYKGELAPEDIYETLSRYDLLLLPTKRYYGEGFPGAILDAYISGIPVLVSEWAYAHEFVEDEVSGFIHNADDTKAFCDTIDLLYNNKELLLERKRSAWEGSKKYSEEEAWKEIEQYL